MRIEVETKTELNGCEPSNSKYTDTVQHYQDNSTISDEKSQEIENEKQHEKELSEKFTPKKQYSELLILSYLRLGYEKKAEDVANCGTFLEFAKYSDASYKLHRANFCRDRLCPLCSWRRSRKVFGQVSQIMNLIEKDYEFIFLTLTVRNCEGEDLSATIDKMNRAWRRFLRYKRISKICMGFFKALEITFNKDRDFDPFHPHFHIIIAVPKNYFVGRDYIAHDEWLNLWRKAMQDPKITQVDVRKVKPKEATDSGADFAETIKSISASVREIAKYSVKASHYLFIDEHLTDYCVSIFADALKGRRLCALGGAFEDAHKKLQLDDSEQGDLIHLDGDVRSDIALQIYRYAWSCGVYKLVEVRDKALDLENVLAEYEEE